MSYAPSMTVSPDKPFRNLDDFAGIASDWFWETDAHHRFCYFSAKMEEVTKFNSNALIGKSRTAVPSENLKDPKWIAHFADLDAHNPFRNFEYQMRRPHDGSLLWIRIAGNPLFNADGTFAGYRGTGHDITHEKVAISRLEEFNAELAERNRQLDELRRSLQRSAFEDALTALANRRAFEQDLNQLVARTNETICLLHIDLDRFKWVNDTLGHPAGDFVLRTAASRIKLVVAETGTVYRVGGDEFMVLLNSPSTAAGATKVGEAIIASMLHPVEFGQRRATVGASIGVTIENSDTISAQRLVGYADAALYEAKRGGRNAVCIIDARIRSTIDDHRKLAADIPEGLDRGEFIPYFQPQMNMQTNEVIGVEVLVRWRHPTRGLLAPGAFFRAAIEQGLMERIDRQMLTKGLLAVDNLEALGLSLPNLSINLSEARLVDPQLPDDVDRLWRNRKCSLSFELLETIYFDETPDSAQSSKNIARLRHIGAGIETDDFGSGRASLTGLLKVSPDRLKIDRNLIKEVGTSPKQRSMVVAILDMATALGIDCIAEGVETDACVEAIRDLGCFCMQGFAISYPVSEIDLIDFLRKHTLAKQAGPHTQTAGPEGLPRTA